MTKETKDLGAAPPRSACEVCDRSLLPKGWDLDRDGQFDNFCTRHLYGNSDVPPAAICYRIGYERRTRQVDKSIANTFRPLERLERLHGSACPHLPAGHTLTGPIRCLDCDGTGKGFVFGRGGLQMRTFTGTAPQAPPDSSAALLEARRLLQETQEWIDPHMDAGLLGRIRAFLRSDSERSEHGKDDEGPAAGSPETPPRQRGT